MNKFMFNNRNLATKDKDTTQQKYYEFIADPKQNQSKQKPELVQIINTAIVDVLRKADIKKPAGKKMSKKIVAEMKNIYDTALAMTALVNKEFGNTYTNFYKMRRGMEEEISKKGSKLHMTKKMKI